MGRHVIAVENLIDGLHIKGHGTYPVGATWNVDSVPERLMEKLKNKETALTPTGKVSPLCVFICPDGSRISIEEAYIEKYGVGKPPTPPIEYVASKKSRTDQVEPEVEAADTSGTASESDSGSESDGSTQESEGAGIDESTSGKKKKKKSALIRRSE